MTIEKSNLHQTRNANSHQDLKIVPIAKSNYTNYTYPDAKPPILLAYGFRPVFFLLAPFMIINILLWSLFWMGLLPLDFFSDPLEWHIYEMVYGVGSAGLIAFLLTGIPEMITKTMPMVGKQLAFLIGIWILGRVSFWLMDYCGILLVAIINVIPLLILIAYAFKPVILDKLQRQASLAYFVIILAFLQFYFFAAKLELVSAYSTDILKLAIGCFMCLIILALRRIKTEAINQRLEDKGLDEILLLRPPRYNLAVFTIILYTVVEFYFPENRILGWLGFAAGAAILGILAELKMQDTFILFESYVIYFSSILLSMAAGYILMGYTYFDADFGSINHFRHLLTIGAFGMAFFLVFVVVSYIHTGRRLKNSASLTLGVLFLFASGILRAILGFFPETQMVFYAVSALLWILAFAIYFIKFAKFLLAARQDGLPG